jgi:hypothetical protein
MKITIDNWSAKRTPAADQAEVPAGSRDSTASVDST